MGSFEYTAAEQRRRYVEKMKEPLGEIYSELWQELARTHHVWGVYFELFGRKPERVSVLNKAASTAFYEIQRALWADVILKLARLTDPPTVKGRSNLSMLCLQELVPDQMLHERLSKLMGDVAFVRDWRNRYLAHNDRELALHAEAKALETATYKKVFDVLERMVSTLDRVSEVHDCGSVNFDTVSTDSESLAFFIQEGLTLTKYRRECRHEVAQSSLPPAPTDL